MSPKTYVLPSLATSTVIPDAKPKDIYHARACIGIAQTLEGVSLMDLTSNEKKKIELHLHLAITQAFKGMLHEARNALVVATDLISASQHIPFERVIPEGIIASKLKNIKFYDKQSKSDLWDTVQPTVKELEDRPLDNRYFAKALMIPAAKKDPVIARSINSLSTAAHRLQFIWITTDHIDSAFECWDVLMDSWMQLPTNWRTETVPSELWNRIKEVFPGDYASFFVSKTIGFIWESCAWHSLYDLANARSSMDEGIPSQAQSLLETAEKWMKVWQILIEYIQEQVGAAKDANVKDKIKNNDIWDLISKCLYGDFKDRFNDSLDDWWGAKKYIVGAACAGPAILTIYTSGGALLLFAIESYVACFMCAMLYGLTEGPLDCVLQAAKDVAICLLDG